MVIDSCLFVIILAFFVCFAKKGFAAEKQAQNVVGGSENKITKNIT